MQQKQTNIQYKTDQSIHIHGVRIGVIEYLSSVMAGVRFHFKVIREALVKFIELLRNFQILYKGHPSIFKDY